MDATAQTNRLLQAPTALVREADLPQLLADYSTELVSILDTDGHFVFVSPSYQRMLGFAPAALIGRRVFDLTHSEDQPRFQQAWQSIQPEQSVQITFRHQHVDQTWRWLQAHSSVIHTGGVYYIVGVAHDVTEQKRTEDEQRKFAALVQNSADLIAIAALTGELQFLNTAGMRLLGIENSAHLSTTPIINMLDGNDGARLINHILPTVVRQGAWVGELHARNQITGDAIPIRSNIFLLTDAASTQPIGYATVSRDIRERLREEERQQLLLDASAALGGSLDYQLTLADFAQVTIRWFAQWCALVLIADDQVEMLAVAHAQAQQQAELERLLRLVPGESLAEENQALRNGQTVLLPNLQATLDGASPNWQQLCAISGPSMIVVPLKLSSQQIGTLCFSSPLDRHYTEEDQHVAEELARRTVLSIENAQLYHDAQAAIGIRDQFLSIASHELKTPLTSILGSLQLLQRRTDRTNTLNERDSRTLQMVIDQTLRLNRLISSLFDLSRLKGNQFEIERSPLDVAQLIAHVVADMQLTTERHTLQHEQPKQACYVLGDAMRLEQVFQNLIQNAIKYSPNGGAIWITVKLANEQVAISVTDHGLGIPQASLPFLFNRFYRAPNVTAQNLSGIGIGLFVVREIIALHGGSISVSSADNLGSTFTVTLPLATSPNPLPRG